MSAGLKKSSTISLLYIFSRLSKTENSHPDTSIMNNILNMSSGMHVQVSWGVFLLVLLFVLFSAFALLASLALLLLVVSPARVATHLENSLKFTTPSWFLSRKSMALVTSSAWIFFWRTRSRIYHLIFASIHQYTQIIYVQIHMCHRINWMKSSECSC